MTPEQESVGRVALPGEEAGRGLAAAAELHQLQVLDPPALQRVQLVGLALIGVHRDPRGVRLHPLGQRVSEGQVVAGGGCARGCRERDCERGHDEGGPGATQRHSENLAPLVVRRRSSRPPKQVSHRRAGSRPRPCSIRSSSVRCHSSSTVSPATTGVDGAGVLRPGGVAGGGVEILVQQGLSRCERTRGRARPVVPDGEHQRARFGRLHGTRSRRRSPPRQQPQTPLLPGTSAPRPPSATGR